MLLSKKTSIKVSREYANLIGHMCYAASKLWNVCNYERQHYKETGMEQYPDWYYQKKAHKEDLWYKQLPSQTAQEVCKLLDKAWKSFYALKRSGGIETPRPPRFKQESIPITYMQMGQRLRCLLNQSLTSSRVGLGLLSRSTFAEIIKPGEQKPHCAHPYAIHATCIGCISEIVPTPSIVVISALSGTRLIL